MGWDRQIYFNCVSRHLAPDQYIGNFVFKNFSQCRTAHVTLLNSIYDYKYMETGLTNKTLKNPSKISFRSCADFNIQLT